MRSTRRGLHDAAIQSATHGPLELGRSQNNSGPQELLTILPFLTSSPVDGLIRSATHGPFELGRSQNNSGPQELLTIRPLLNNLPVDGLPRWWFRSQNKSGPQELLTIRHLSPVYQSKGFFVRVSLPCPVLTARETTRGGLDFIKWSAPYHPRKERPWSRTTYRCGSGDESWPCLS